MNNFDPAIINLIKDSVRIRHKQMPQEVFDKATALFLDTIACIYAGSSIEGISELRKLILRWAGGGDADVISFGDKISAPYAAFLNSAMAHARDFDDTHDLAVNHGCVTIVPALLAVSQSVERQISGREFLAALAVGLEVSNRFGMAFIEYLHPGWLPTTLWGPIGSAIACGRILGLNEAQMRNAVGFAYSQIHGNRQALEDGAFAKKIQPAFSSQAGVIAAYLAKINLSAARNIISGNFGIPKLYTKGNIEESFLVKGIDNFDQLFNVSVKPYPCCRCTHPVIDAAMELCEKYKIMPDDVIEGVCYLPPSSMAQIGKHFTLRDNPAIDAQFSAAYTAALAISKGKIGVSDFTVEAITGRGDILKLADKFKCVEFEKSSSTLTPVELKIKNKQNQVYQTRIEHVTGSREKPLSEQQFYTKFADCLLSANKLVRDSEIKTIYAELKNLISLKDIKVCLDKLIVVKQGGI